jgi:outer membrane protein assembly factor BamB
MPVSFSARLSLSAVTLLSLLLISGADWRQFRGSQSNSVAAESRLPLDWSATSNVAWRTPLPGKGASGPIVIGDRIYVTRSGGIKQDRLHVLCFHSGTGKQIWRRDFWATGRTYTHPVSSVAAPTPASDGKRIVAFYSSNDLVCLDLDGNLLWYRALALDFAKAGNDVGMSSSPTIAGDVVVVQAENQGNSFATGIDIKTGEQLWEVKRQTNANWSSPIAFEGPTGKPAVLLQSPIGLTAYDAAGGEVLWEVEMSCGNIVSPTLAGDLVLVHSNGLTAIRIGKGVTQPEVAWTSNRLGMNGASPVVHDGKIYLLSGSIARCADLATGELEWQVRLEGRFWASPILAGGHLYFINQEGDAQVVSVGTTGTLVAKSAFGEVVQGTPAVVGNAMFVCTDKRLWKITE